jgi:hypothetical protein
MHPLRINKRTLDSVSAADDDRSSHFFPNDASSKDHSTRKKFKRGMDNNNHIKKLYLVNPKYGNDHGETGKFGGTRMEVTLGPAYGQLGGYGGSWTNKESLSGRMKALHYKDRGFWVAGHLLCRELGGSGLDTRNLTPLTHTANMNMSGKCENKVKRWVGLCGLYMMNNKDDFGTHLCLGVRYIVEVSTEKFGNGKIGAYEKVASHLTIRAEVVLMDMSNSTLLGLSDSIKHYWSYDWSLDERIDNDDSHLGIG